MSLVHVPEHFLMQEDPPKKAVGVTIFHLNAMQALPLPPLSDLAASASI